MMTDKDDVDSLNEEMSETKRKWRNLSEKKRRDSFNMLIGELANIVSTNGRKVDKSNVLKQTIAFLQKNSRNANKSQQADSGNSPSSDNFKPPFLSNEEYLYLLIENLEAFLLVISCHEQIVYVSEKMKEIFGVDFSGKYLSDLVDHESCLSFNKLLAEQSSDALKTCDEAGFYSLHWTFLFGNYDCETAKIEGRFKSMILTDDQCTDFGLNCNSNEEALCFVAIGKFLRFPMQTIFRFPSRDKIEFVCKFNMEWKFIYLDQRSIGVTGYLPMELIGISGYQFYHSEDLENISSCHENIIKNGEATSESYRFKIKADRYIWLKSQYSFVYNQWNSKPECVLCTSQVLHGDIQQKIFNDRNSPATGRLHVKCEPINDNSNGQSELDFKKQIFRPQPGVFIEHSPISSNGNISSKSQRKSTNNHSPIDLTSFSEESNARLVELLLQRENALKQEILQKERQLQSLQMQYRVRTPNATNNIESRTTLLHGNSGPSQNGNFDLILENNTAIRLQRSPGHHDTNGWPSPVLNLHVSNGISNGSCLPY